MRRFSNIDNQFCINQGINLPQAYVYEWMLNLSKWASTIIIEGSVFYFASKNKAVEDLIILTSKTNTMHTYYKALEQKGLIIIRKIDSKDYVHITEKSREWNLSKSFEKNQSELGFLSKETLDKNQTYSNTIPYSNSNDNVETPKEEFPESLFQNQGGDVLNGQKEKRKKAESKKEKIYSEECHAVLNHVLGYFPENCRPVEKSVNKWLSEIDKLIRIDNVPATNIQEIVIWARTDVFWSRNFFSILKLRKKNKEDIPYITVFYNQMQKPNKSNDRKSEQASAEFVALGLDLNDFSS